jgi:hypothetical protein
MSECLFWSAKNYEAYASRLIEEPSKQRWKSNEAGGEIHGQVRCDP